MAATAARLGPAPAVLLNIGRVLVHWLRVPFLPAAIAKVGLPRSSVESKVMLQAEWESKVTLQAECRNFFIFVRFDLLFGCS